MCPLVASGFVPLGISSPAISSCFRWRLMAVWLLVVLQWKEPEAGGSTASTSPSIKLVCSPDRDDGVNVLHLPGHRGGGEDEEHRFAAVLCGSAERVAGSSLPWPWSSTFFCAEHTATVDVAVTSGRQGGPHATSIAEALLQRLRRSSTLPGSQVVRPRILGGGVSSPERSLRALCSRNSVESP